MQVEKGNGINIAPLEEAKDLKPGFYFVVAKSPDLDQCLSAAQDGLNKQVFKAAELKQILLTQQMQASRFTPGGHEMLYVICAVIQIHEIQIAEIVQEDLKGE